MTADVVDVDVAATGGVVVEVCPVPADVVGVVCDVGGGRVLAEVDVAGIVVVAAGAVVDDVAGGRVVLVDVRLVVVDGSDVVEVVVGRAVVVVVADVVTMPVFTMPVVTVRVVDVDAAVLLDDDVGRREVLVLDGLAAGGAMGGSGPVVGAGVTVASGARSTWCAAAAVNPLTVKVMAAINSSGQNLTRSG